MFPSLPMPDEYRKLSELYVPEQEPFNPQPRSSPFEGLDLIAEDWEKKSKELEQQQRQRAQRYARTNAISDAFRLLTQAVGGAKGATIPKETPNKGVLNAYNQYMAMDQAQRDRLDRFKALELQNLARGIEHELDLEQEQRARQYGTSEREATQEFEAGQAEKERGFEREMFGEKTEAERDIIEERGRQERLTEQKKADLGSWYYNRDRGTKQTSGFQRLDPQMQVQVRDALVRLYRQKAEQTDQRPPDVVRAIERNEIVRDEAIDQVIMDNYDYLKEVIPGFEQAFPRPPAGTTQTSSTDQAASSVGNKQLLSERVNNILARTGRPDKPNKKLRDNRRPNADAEKQADQKDRVGYLMRALHEFDPQRSWQDLYQDALDLIEDYNQMIYQRQSQGQGTIEKDMQSR